MQPTSDITGNTRSVPWRLLITEVGMIKAFKRRLSLDVLFFIVGITIPIALLFAYISNFAVNVPYYDDWDYINYLQKAALGDLTLKDLWSIQSDCHRLIVPFVLMIGIDLMTNYDVVVRMFINAGMFSAECLLLLLLAIQRKRLTGRGLLLLLPIPWLILNLRQWEVLLWGFTFTGGCTCLSLIATLFILDHIRRGIDWKIFLAIVIALVCSFTAFNNLLVWPLGLILLSLKYWLSDRTKDKILPLLVWVGGMIFAMVLYFSHWKKTLGGNSIQNLLFLIRDPLLLLKYFLAGIGSTLAVSVDQAIANGIVLLGLIVLILFCLVTKRIRMEENLVAPFILIVFGFLTTGMIEVGRIQFGLESAIASRYAVFGSIMLVGLYIFVLSASFSSKRLSVFVFDSLLTLIVIGILTTLQTAVPAGEGHRDTCLLWSSQLKNIGQQSDEALSLIYKDPTYLRRYAAFLQGRKFSVFSKSIVDIRKFKKLPDYRIDFRVEQVGQGKMPFDGYLRLVTVDPQRQKTLMIKGWVCDLQYQGPFDCVFVSIDGKFDVPAAYGLTRHDIERTLCCKSYLRTGFIATFSPSLLSKGKHDVTLKVVPMGTQTYFETPLITKIDIL